MLVTRSDLSKEPCNGTASSTTRAPGICQGHVADHRVALSRRVCTSLGLLENLAVAGMPLDGPQDRADSGYLHRRTLRYKMLQPPGRHSRDPLRRSFAAQLAPRICVQTHISLPCKRNRRPLRDRRNLLPTLLPAAHKPSSLLVWDSR